MFERITAFLRGDEADADAPADDGALADAAAAILVETALLDGEAGDDERRTILAILTEQFDLSPDDAARTMAAAFDGSAGANTLYSATRLIKERYTEEQRISVMQMLWRVAYADGTLHDYEANLVRRIAGLLYVRDQDSGRARKRALEDLGLADTE